MIEEVKVLIAGGTLFSYEASLHTVPSEEEMKPGVIKAMCLLVAHDCNRAAATVSPPPAPSTASAC